jgi:2-polyprenyl-3-methyl-5-hydroxy-6-metoxy-1,4-benzoquinol methylase
VPPADPSRPGEAEAKSRLDDGTPAGSARLTLAGGTGRSMRTRLAVARQRKLWTKRAESWGHDGSADLRSVVGTVLRNVPCGVESEVLDIGCGTGALSLPLARRGARVLAVDVSSAMTNALRAEADAEGLDKVTTMAVPAEELELRPASLDAVVSNYALHHLRDEDKAILIRSIATWLRPGGRLVIGDMMFGRGATPRDRRIIVGKVFILARKGPAGWWRIAKNAVRFLLRLQERPLRIESWVALLEGAGFVSVTAIPVVAEAAVVVGVRPVRSSSRTWAQDCHASPGRRWI